MTSLTVIFSAGLNPDSAEAQEMRDVATQELKVLQPEHEPRWDSFEPS